MGSDRQRLSADMTHWHGGTDAIGQYVGVALNMINRIPVYGILTGWDHRRQETGISCAVEAIL